MNEDMAIHNMELLVLGTSNSIGPASYAGRTGQKLGAKLTNLSVGASSSTLGLYQLHKVQPVRRGVALIDFAINDTHTGLSLWGKENAAHCITDNIRAIVARLHAMNFLPIVVISAACPETEAEPLANTLYRELCLVDHVNFIDIRSLVVAAIGRGASRAQLMRDDCHMSARTAEEVATFLEAVIRRISAADLVSLQQSTTMLQTRAVYAAELFPPSALVKRGSSLRSALHGRLTMGETLHLSMAPNERLQGLMVNVGAKGGTVEIRGGGPDVVKSMTVYWDAARPAAFLSVMIDFAHPLPGNAEGITIQFVGPDAVPTEPTMHSRPVVPERYGEIEIEGALMVGSDKVSFDYLGPPPDWLPLDLIELPEGRQLSERLAGLATMSTDLSMA